MRSVFPGSPTQLGATFHESFWNFAIASPHTVTHLVIGDYETGNVIDAIKLDPTINRTGNVWHIAIEAKEDRLLYGYKVRSTQKPLCSNLATIAVDPYAKLVKTGNTWGNNAWTTLSDTTGSLVSVAFRPQVFTWNDRLIPKKNDNNRIIYEAHVRGMTQHPSSCTQHPGTFLSLIEKLDHLHSLGVTTIELLPIYEWDETEWHHVNPKTKKRLCNYWGYSPLSFFSPMQRYGTTADPLTTSFECKQLIQACHDRNLEVILDVVYNHTGEGNQHGPAYSFKIFDQNSYYIMDPGEYCFTNYSGCGNTLNANHPLVQELILASLRHFVVEYHVDGFRFDLASALTRNQLGAPMNEPSVLEAIAKDPILSKTTLIAEPWDAAGLYQTGVLYRLNQKKEHFFSEWNDRYRDDVRQFINGIPHKAGLFATRLCGSNDLYDNSLKNTINYITAHDGFSLLDLVSYNHKHNLENGEHNKDGCNANYSWNCGTEGKSTKAATIQLRQRQMINFFTALLMSQGVPMLLMGDECALTKSGNNNAWCQDAEENWLNWEQFENHERLRKLISTLCLLRKKSDCFHLNRSLTSTSIQWHGQTLNTPNWRPESHLVVCTLCDTKNKPRLFLAFNSAHQAITIEIPQIPGMEWKTVVNTSKSPLADIFELCKGPAILSHRLKLMKHSCLVLEAHPISRNT